MQGLDWSLWTGCPHKVTISRLSIRVAESRIKNHKFSLQDFLTYPLIKMLPYLQSEGDVKFPIAFDYS